MKTFARIFIFAFAVAAIVAILVHWKRHDRETALAELRDRYGADVSITEDEFFIGCDSPLLTDLVALGELVSRIGDANVLDLTGSPALESFRGAELFPSLRALVAIDCPKLTSADGLAGHPTLSDISLVDSAALADVSAIRSSPVLKTLDLSGCLAVESVDLSSLPGLENLYLSRCRNLAAVDVLSLPQLRQLYLDGCAGIETIKGLERLSELTDLDISNATGLRNLDGIGALKSLVILDYRNVDLERFDEIGTLPNLRVMRLGGQSNLKSLKPFSGLTTLREIHLEACPEFLSLEGLPASVSQYAGFTYCPKLTSLSGIEAATGLEQLDVKGCMNLSEITGVRALENLVQLNLVQCRQVTEISPILGLEKLVIVMLGGSGVVPAAVENLETANEELIFDFSVSE